MFFKQTLPLFFNDLATNLLHLKLRTENVREWSYDAGGGTTGAIGT